METQALFQTYLQLGFEHITDLEGYDHILFLVALCAIYQVREWRKVAILVTAFTIGHCITLVLAAQGVIGFSQAWIEFLIPVSILFTALYNIVVFRAKENTAEQHIFSSKLSTTYLITLFFGLIHGLGFSNFFRVSLFPGEEQLLLWQLLYFNIGVELGQLTIVGIILLLSYLVLDVFKVKQQYWVIIVSLLAGIPALFMAFQRIPL